MALRAATEGGHVKVTFDNAGKTVEPIDRPSGHRLRGAANHPERILQAAAR